MKKLTLFKVMAVCAGINFLISISAQAATVINFSGTLDIVELDLGGGVYSGTPIGTMFNGYIDDVTANGVITDGTKLTSFGCCIAAGGLDVTNDFVIDADYAMYFNQLSNSSSFSAGDIFDIVDIEGDESVSGGGRIEVGLSYILDKNAFSDESLSNYPFDPSDVLLALFFIAEENSSGDDIYSAVGQINAVPLPATIWLFGAGILGLLRYARASTTYKIHS